MRLTRTISSWSGEMVSPVACVSSAIFPNAECEPVAKTSAFASPETSEVPARSVLRAVHRLGLVARLGVARDRQRFAGDGRVVHPHAERLHKPAVRGKDVAGFEQDHVARHELGRGHLPHGARAHDLRRIRKQFLERRQRLLGAIRLPEREHAIDHDHADDREPERRHALPGSRHSAKNASAGGNPQNQSQRSATNSCANVSSSASCATSSTSFVPNSTSRRCASASLSPASPLFRLAKASATVQMMNLHRIPQVQIHLDSGVLLENAGITRE